MYKEHPKMLYQGDKTRIAKDAEAEELLRLDGWHDYGQEPEPVAPVAEPTPEPAPEPQAEKPKPAPRKAAAKPQAEA